MENWNDYLPNKKNQWGKVLRTDLNCAAFFTHIEGIDKARIDNLVNKYNFDEINMKPFTGNTSMLTLFRELHHIITKIYSEDINDRFLSKEDVDNALDFIEDGLSIISNEW